MNKKANLTALLMIFLTAVLTFIAISLGAKVLQDVDNNFAIDSAASNTTDIFLTKYNTYTSNSMFKIVFVLLAIPLIIYVINLLRD